MNEIKQKIVNKVFLNEKGSALVMTLGVLLILSILGISIGALTIGSYRLSDANRDDTSAYYIAEAGAEMAYEELSSKVWTAYNKESITSDSFFNEVSGIVDSVNNEEYTFNQQFGENTTATVIVELNEEGTSRTYKISSTGKIGNKNRVVQKEFVVNWVKKSTGSGNNWFPKEFILLSKGNIEFNNGIISNNIFTGSVVSEGVKITGNPKFENSTLYHLNKIKKNNLFKYPDWFESNLPNIISADEYVDYWKEYSNLIDQITIPTISELIDSKHIKHSEKVLDDKGNVTISSGNFSKYDLNIKQEKVYIPKLKIIGNVPVTLNVGNSDTTILVDELVINTNSFEIVGDNKLTIVVKKSININGSASINGKGLTNQLVLIYHGEEKIKFGEWGQNIFNGHIIVKSADISAKSSNINGVLLTGGKKVDLSGGVTNSNLLLIAPNSHVSLSESYSILGTVIANSFQMSGGTKLIYGEVGTTGFPLLSSGGTVSPPSKDDIIHAEPILEK